MSALDSSSPAQEVVSFASKSVRLDKVLAEGGFAAVYSATSTSGEPFVVKKIVVQAPEVIKQTEIEVKIHSTLQHPNIVRLHDVKREQIDNATQCFYLLLEACPRGDLMARIENAKTYISTQTVVKTFRSICAAIAHLHEVTTPSAAHRDIKFENVLIAQDGTLKLCDFGSLSQYHGVVGKADRVQVEDSVTRFCTPQYRAPELVDLYCGEPVDNRSDIWALGCILYGLMFRTHPWDVTSSLAILSGKYSVPEGHPYPPPLLHALDCCLAVRPVNRPTAASLQAYFEALEAGSSPPPLATSEGAPALPQAEEAEQRQAQEAQAAAARRHAAANRGKPSTSHAPVKTSAASSALQARLAAARGAPARGGSAGAARGTHTISHSAHSAPGSDEYDPFTAAGEQSATPAAPAPDADDDPFGSGAAAGGADPFSSGGVDDPFASGGAGNGDDPFGASGPSVAAPPQDWAQSMGDFAATAPAAGAATDDPFASPPAESQPTAQADPFASGTPRAASQPAPAQAAARAAEDEEDLLAGQPAAQHNATQPAAPESLAQRVQRMQASAAAAAQGTPLYHSSPGNPFVTSGGGVPPGAGHRHSASAGQRISMMGQPQAAYPGGMYAQYAPGMGHPMPGQQGGWM